MNLNLTSKYCIKCKKRKSVSVFNFYKNSSGFGDGFGGTCRVCVLSRAKKRRK